jgi:Mg-chelatase subunit ChlD
MEGGHPVRVLITDLARLDYKPRTALPEGLRAEAEWMQRLMQKEKAASLDIVHEVHSGE